MLHVHVVACIQVCVCVCCVCVSENNLDERLRVCMRAHKRMYHNEKKIPDKTATTTSDASDTSGVSSKHNAKENST